LTNPPPQQKPTIPILRGMPSDRRIAPNVATPSATVSAMSSWPIMVRARSSSPAGVPPSGLSQSGASAW
jgi:hypothetical protein